MFNSVDIVFMLRTRNAPASKRNFTDAHTYFDWIFDLDSKRDGYVKKR